MKSVGTVLGALTTAVAFCVTAEATTLYTMPLQAAAGNCLVCGAMVVGRFPSGTVNFDIVDVHGGPSVAGGSCTGMTTVGAYCDIPEAPCASPQYAYCKITFTGSARSVRGTLMVVDGTGQTIATTPTQ